jgi:hypothetical protein
MLERCGADLYASTGITFLMQKVLDTLKRFRWHQWLVVILFVFVLGFTGYQVFRTARHAIYWRHHQDEPIRAWMTVGHVAHSYRVPVHVLYEALGLTTRPDKRPLRVIAKSQNRSVEEIREILEQAITNARRSDPPAFPPPPRPAAGQQNPGGAR